ncbi:hypothetical protein PPTG_00315 [Phytophthora nicotianae INRA-310]|uniref:Uncharacterized protein n=1 Tax=Phytophthora nicotianae (strain INRA-310) TaxID=761204 RepID=W2RF03_PHYN3|nr:hypothetical protein PPTG_00315 [Phytophthora nicotianae INRA-310]ETN23796.1 hypothetical protein PPTG_00315 [Phytophthora nicotianae INRA-310]
MPSVLAEGPRESPPPHASSAISRCRTYADRIEHRNQMDQVRRERDAAWHRNMRNGRERDGLVEDPEQSEEPGQVEEPELLERLLQVSDDDAPANALVDSEIDDYTPGEE